jgi:hypothetical protein
MQSSRMPTEMNSPYPSSRPDTPPRMQFSTSSSSDTATSQRYPALPLPRTSGITRPSTYSQDKSWGYSPGSRAGSKISYEIPVNSDFDQPQSLSYPYASFVNDIWSVERQILSMPDLNEHVGPVLARGNARQAARQPQGNTRPVPYPLHDQDVQPYSEDDIHGAYGGLIHQPTEEDFLRPHQPLPVPPAEYDSDQDLSVIEPDSHEYFLSMPHADHAAVQTQAANRGIPTRRSTTANPKSHRLLGIAPAQKRSKADLVGPSHAPSLTNEQPASMHQNTPVRVGTMCSDMYQPALGGLQKITGIQRKDSKRDRFKRFVKGMNPFQRQREFGRASRN